MFAIHPYLIPSKLPPTFAHPLTTTIGVADYPKLVKLLTAAFRGTAQRGETLPIVYDEFGYQSKIPQALRFVYSHLGAKAAADAIPESTAGEVLREGVRAGGMPADGRRDADLPRRRRARRARMAVGPLLRQRQAEDEPPGGACRGARRADGNARRVREGEDDRERRRRRVRQPVDDGSRHAPRPGSRATCPAPTSCASSTRRPATRLRAPSGKAVGPTTVKIPTAALAPGQYEYALRAFKCGKPGTGRDALQHARSRSAPPT